MNTPYPHVPVSTLAYVRRVERAALPAEVQAQLPPDVAVWGVHDADGKVLALTGDRKMAFTMARENDLAPVSVH